MELEDQLFWEGDDLDILEVIDNGFPRRVADRTNYFDTMDDLGFFRRFRLTKPTVLHVVNEIRDQLEFDNNLNNPVSPINQVLTTLRFFATNAHQVVVGDFLGIHQTTVSRILSKVPLAIANLRPQYINMPNNNEILHTQNEFYRISRFPRIVGCIDGTHIKIQSPGGEDPEIFRNRKSYFSVNTQVVGGPNLKIQDIVARWPGSTHDAVIFNNSRILGRFEAGEFGNSVLLGATSDILQKVGLSVAGKQRCNRQYHSNGLHITNTQQCVGGTTNQDSCSGDSGGPMLVVTRLPDWNSVYVQHGIVSYGRKQCGISSFPGVYTLVKYYMDWILDNIRP